MSDLVCLLGTNNNKSMNKLTIIIPFLNEGDEIEKTLKSIRETSRTNVDIIIINDCSTDNFDYLYAAKKIQRNLFLQ